jgi:pSer/pThr/pTyr-binding forkhead associated (FHA) protein
MIDWGRVALELGRKSFNQKYAHPFLLSVQGMNRPVKPMRTEKIERTDLIRLGQPNETPTGPRVAPVVKSQPNFPSMITVGRTANNDIVIGDSQVSKFHAWFRLDGGTIKLEDAGSSNGTFVDGKQIHKGSPLQVTPGAVLRFAMVEMRLVDPDTCWQKLIDALDPWD